MKDSLRKIDVQKAELDALRPIDVDHEEALWQKFRLEWNYNSNHLEGNTMTYGQTQLLLRLGDEFKAESNTLKDVNEMRAHDTAIHIIRKMASEQDRPLTQQDIRELNRTILVKDFYSDAVTPNGQPTRKLIKVGEYKTQPNSVILPSGELFESSAPIEVPQKMQELLDWYAEQEEEDALVTAAFLHYKFVLIHPFDDGNGRVSRLLMNYHLMRHGYPPLIIKSADKKNYLYALQQADAGDVEAFVSYLAKQLLWSLELALKAAKGEEIKEEGDLDKEIAVWKKQVMSGVKPGRSVENLRRLLRNSLGPLEIELKQKFDLFREVFAESAVHVYHVSDDSWERDFWETEPIEPEHIDSAFERNLVGGMSLSFELKGPRNVSLNDREAKIAVGWQFDKFSYAVWIDDETVIANKAYDALLSQDEIDKILEEFSQRLFDRVKEVTSGE